MAGSTSWPRNSHSGTAGASGPTCRNTSTACRRWPTRSARCSRPWSRSSRSKAMLRAENVPATAGRPARPPDRRLPDPPRDRPGRDGGGLRGRAGLAWAAGWPSRSCPATWSRDRKALERFRREAKAAARLHHTNIVPVFEVGRDGEVGLLRHAVHPGPGARPGHRRAASPAVARRPAITARRDEPRAGRDRRRARVGATPSLRIGRVGLAIAPDRPAGRATGPSSPRPAGPAAADRPGRTERLDPDATSDQAPAAATPEPPRPPPDPARRPRPCCRAAARSRRSTPRAAGRRSSGAWPRSAARRRRGWPTPMPAASSTATSSRRTCCSTPPGSSGSPTSAWPRRTTTG